MQENRPWHVITIHRGFSFDAFFAFLFALLPIVQPLKTFLPVTWSMAILILAVPYLVIKMSRHSITLKHSLPVWIYVFYRIINHGTDASELLTMLFLGAVFVALYNGLLDTDAFFRFNCGIAVFAAALIILQTVLHYTVNVHLRILSPSLLRTEEMRTQYAVLLSTGISSGIYRPTAFFVEPSAFSLYYLPALLYQIFYGRNKKQALILSLGGVLTTSGMGILFVVVLWGWYFLKSGLKKGRVNKRKLGIALLFVLAGIILIVSVPVLRSAVVRIFTTFNGGNSAILGRLGSGAYYYSSLTPKERLLGAGRGAEDYAMFLSGMYSLIVDCGIIGYILFVLLYVYLAVKIKNAYRILPLCIAAISVMSNVTVIHYQVYMLLAIMSCFQQEKQ